MGRIFDTRLWNAPNNLKQIGNILQEKSTEKELKTYTPEGSADGK